VNKVKPKETKDDHVDVEKLVKEEIRRKEQEKLEQETDKMYAKWLESVPEDKREAMREDYEDLSDGRKLAPEKAKKLMEKIEASYRKQELEEERRDGALARASASQIGKRSGETENKKANKTQLAWLK